MIGLSFGDYNMQTDGCRVHETDVFSSPPNKIQADQLPEADGAVIVKQQYTSKTFTVEGKLQQGLDGSVLTMRELEDAFKLAMSSKNQAFDVEEDGVVRRYLANAQNVVLARRSNKMSAFSVEMLSPDGMGWDVDSTSLLSATGITVSTVQTPITVEGTYRAEPLITAVINSFTGTGDRTVTISNGSTLRSISITLSTWTAGDIIEIDSLNKTIYVNNAPVEFSGQFPRWDVGDGTIGWLDTFTARSVTLTASYQKRWL